jgi:hypothetical protein
VGNPRISQASNHSAGGGTITVKKYGFPSRRYRFKRGLISK